MHKPHTISVIIPCFNNSKTITETLDAIGKQTHPPIEIIIVNDGSTDDSQSIVDQYCAEGKKFRTISKTNGGPASARNEGSKVATGEYLLFIDADDLIAPTFIEKCINLISNDPGISIAYTKAVYFEAQQGEWKLPEFNMPDFLLDNCIPITSVIKRNRFQQIGGFDENLDFLEDWDLWIRIIKEGGTAKRINEHLFYYRKRFNQTSLTDNKFKHNKSDESRLYVYNKNYPFYRQHNLDLTNLIIQQIKLAKKKRSFSAKLDAIFGFFKLKINKSKTTTI